MLLFEIPKRQGRETDKKIATQTRITKKAPSTGASLSSRIAAIQSRVEQTLGKYADDYVLIRDAITLRAYVDKCVANGVVSIDTETTGLDPMQDKLVGLCLYTPNMPAAYIPINHISYITYERVADQMSERDVEQCIQPFSTIDVIMFNANFDIRVLRNQLNTYLTCTWDCYLAARLMNENEGFCGMGLKALHRKYVLDDAEDEFSFDALFKGVSFDVVPIPTAYLYAAHDAIITYELYEFQKQYMYYDASATADDRNGMNGVAWVFFNIEMPCVNVVCDMEDTGVKFDFEYAEKLSVKYNALMHDAEQRFAELCDAERDKIDAYKRNNPNHKLNDPINIGSSSQIATLLYDVLQIESPDEKNPRGTGEHILSRIDHPIAKAVLKWREVSKLVSTYIDKLPQCVNPNDGRIHCSFNQYGADTGRFSSSDPNLQNLPSHAKDIRPMFIASNDVIEVETVDNCFTVEKWCEVKTDCGWKYASSICVGDRLCINDNNDSSYVIVSDIKVMAGGFKFYY